MADDWDKLEAEVEEDDLDIDDEVDFAAPDAVCVQVYVLADGIFLVRRSRTALRTLRFVDHDASSMPIDIWQDDDPFDDCTDGYLYTATGYSPQRRASVGSVTTTRRLIGPTSVVTTATPSNSPAGDPPTRSPREPRAEPARDVTARHRGRRRRVVREAVWRRGVHT